MPNRTSNLSDFAARYSARALAASGPKPAGSQSGAQAPPEDPPASDALPAPPPSGAPPFQGADLVVADALAELGWDAESIRKILAGPDQASIHELANPKFVGTPFEGTPGTVAKEPSDGPPPGDGPNGPAGPSPASSPTQPSSLYWPTAYSQPVIVQAIWSSLHGEPSALIELADNVKALPPVLQAYVKAASEAGKRDYVDLEKWKAAFDSHQASAQAQQSKETKDREAAIASAVSAAAAAANALPAVGQVVSAVLLLSLAIRAALLGAFPLPIRKAEDQVRDGYEGRTCYAGISWAVDHNDYLHTKQWVVQDPVAAVLPAVPLRTPFPFSPTIRDFQTAVRSLKLYDSIGRPDLNTGGDPDYSTGGS